MSSNSNIKGLIDASTELQKFEKIPTKIFDTPQNAEMYVADEIEKLIRTSKKKPVVLGLATGSTPKGKFNFNLNYSFGH